MARGVNKVILVGNLGADPEIRFSPSGTAVTKFRLATTESVRNSEGNWEDRTEWHRVVAFGKTAETCGQFLAKGRQVYIEGKLQTQQWEDAQGVKHYTTEVVARDVLFLGGAAGQARQASSALASGESQNSFGPSMSEELPAPGSLPEDEIPF
jgi:single-strand DNA-binding protein